jgi:hypothetical protein
LQISDGSSSPEVVEIRAGQRFGEGQRSPDRFRYLFQKMALFDPNRGTLKVWLLQFAYSLSINRRYHLQRQQFYNQAELEEVDIAHLAFRRSCRASDVGESRLYAPISSLRTRRQTGSF